VNEFNYFPKSHPRIGPVADAKIVIGDPDCCATFEVRERFVIILLSLNAYELDLEQEHADRWANPDRTNDTIADIRKLTLVRIENKLVDVIGFGKRQGVNYCSISLQIQ
jgi:hypothetical protein